MTEDKATPPPIRRIGAVRKRVAHGATSLAGGVVDVAGELAHGVVPVAGAVVHTAGELVEDVPTVARQLVATTRDAAEARRERGRPGARTRRNEPLPNLFEVHPEARLAPTRE